VPLTRIRPLDGLIIALTVAALLALSVTVYTGRGTSNVVITSCFGEWIYPLSEDRLVVVDGIIGSSVVHIHDGTAHIDESPCANQTCVASKPISNTGEWSACLPNGVFIRIDGSEATDGIDAFAR
jgi:hypothetical protein